jgi:flavin-dependent dehydrogenase
MDRLNGADVKLETLDALNRFLIQNEDLPDYLTEQEKSGADEKLKQLALRKITLKSKEWTDQTMSQNIHELSPSDLANLNHKLAACLQSPPEYITEDDLSKVSVQREEVQQLITKHKVTLLIDDYKTLEPNAREDFIHQLKLLRQSEEKSHEF